MSRKKQTIEPKESQRKKIADDVEAFLKKGGTIEQIEVGPGDRNFSKPQAKFGRSKKPE